MRYFLYFFVFISLSACKKDVLPPNIDLSAPSLPNQLLDYSTIDLHSHFEGGSMSFLLGNNLAENPITDAGATLGRVLFYDKKLSVNNEISCASCHQQKFGFSDPRRFSEGFDGEITARNSMPLGNTLYSRRFFWDRRVNTLSQQVLMPIQDSIEMGMKLNQLVPKLQDIGYYPPLFQAAFGSDTITLENVQSALVQFVNSMLSYQSKYDEGIATDFANFSDQELRGKSLYFTAGLGCNHCHTNATFKGNFSTNNGLAIQGNDLGVGDITQNPANDYQFSVPSLRNVALTAPYMHDGRFATLAEVIDFYSDDVQAFNNLDDRLTIEGQTGGTPRRSNLSTADRAALVAFLNTLTDRHLTIAEKWSNPFH